MKKLLGYLIFIGFICVLLYLYLDYKAQKKAERLEMEERKREIEEIRKIEQEQARMTAEYERQLREKRLQDRKKREAIISGRRGAPALSVPTPFPTRNTVSDFQYKARVETACRESRCALIKYQESADSSYIVVQGPDHNTVSNVLDYLIRAGMKDFTDHKDQFKVEMIQGRRVYTAAYTIKW